MALFIRVTTESDSYYEFIADSLEGPVAFHRDRGDGASILMTSTGLLDHLPEVRMGFPIVGVRHGKSVFVSTAVRLVQITHL